LSHNQDDRDQNHDHQAADAKVPDDRFEQAEVAAQQITCDTDDGRPGEAAERAEKLETPERHAGHAGEHRAPGAQSEDEARDENGLVTVPGEEHLRARDVLGPDPEQAAEPFDKWTAAAESKQVAEA